MKELHLLHDDELVARYQNGSNEAFDMLLTRYQKRLYSYIFCIVRDSDMADDFFQETFVKAILAIQQGKYTAGGKFYPWLTRIAHNTIFDQFRSEKNDRSVSKDEVEGDLFAQVGYYEESHEDTLVFEQTVREAQYSMEQLPEALREVVFMRCYQGMGFKEIAEATGVSINTALGRMRYATLHLRKMMAK